MTREEALNNLNHLLQYGGLVMSEKYIESIRIATIELEKTLKQEACEDAISRQQAIDKMQELEDEDIEAYGCSIPEGFDGERAIEALKTLPSVQIQPKTGHWIDDNDGYGTSCSECDKWYPHPYLAKREIIYCCRCGVKMFEPQESEG